MIAQEPKIFTRLSEKLAEWMIENAETNWQDYIVDDWIYIDVEQTIENAYLAVTKLDIPDSMHERLKDDSTILGAVEVMRDVIKEEMDCYQAAERYYNGTMAEKLRERGMSERDFI